MDRQLPSRNLTLADLQRDLRKKLAHLIETKAKDVQNSSRNGGHRSVSANAEDRVQPFHI